MRFVLALLLFCCSMTFVGCGESKPDPREREGFVDTTDPSAIADPAAADGGGGAPEE